MNSSAVTMVKWVPGSESIFMAAYQDGSIIVFDKERDDQGFSLAPAPDGETGGYGGGKWVRWRETWRGWGTATAEMRGRVGNVERKGSYDGFWANAESVLSRDQDFQPHIASPTFHPRSRCSRLHVTRPQKNNKHNPVAHWQVSKKAITAFAFSPDLQHVAVVGMDGLLRVIDWEKEKLYDTYGSYFGGLNCVAWSPDGRYILTGGQDDLVTIWAFREQKIVARCQGHQSWVTAVAFDPYRCDEKVYRFGSLAEDAKLILWDFSVSALHRPKGVSDNPSPPRLFRHLNQRTYWRDDHNSNNYRSGRGWAPVPDPAAVAHTGPIAPPPHVAPRAAKVARRHPAAFHRVHRAPRPHRRDHLSGGRYSDHGSEGESEGVGETGVLKNICIYTCFACFWYLEMLIV
ncbi:hypothetical protein BC936DRAFT_137062 [Jimgerdemannia flammicorona]|uniref:Uncharacterized protein n=1 Tax=Jimgerdemannia flammicorona TaxID=994334 RepID=A0A433DJP0_9FUNG|nr:hypothetical protein BC936DRAFT_137062 [Jimgerdemannia flammicorona]